MSKHAVALVGTLIAACLPGRVAAYCLEYGTNSLFGTLVRQTYPGPPDYKSFTRGDRPVVIWVLLVDPPICVVDPDYRSPKESYAREVQLLLEEGQYEQYRELLGNKVVVTGDLQHSRGDYKRLLIAPLDIARARMR